MTPAEVRTMKDNQIVELLVNFHPSSDAVAWLASVIADPSRAAGVAELSRRYAAKESGRCSLPRARSAYSVWIDGEKFKRYFFSRRIALREVGPLAGLSEGYASVTAHKGRMSYWTADRIATALGERVDDFIAAVGSPEEVMRLSV